MTTSPTATASVPRVVHVADARYNSGQSEALSGALERTVERMVVSLGPDAPPAVLEPARLALDDARRLTERLHHCRRMCETLGHDDELTTTTARRTEAP